MTTSVPVVAVDGPSGSGKSTVSRRVASALGLAYVDTGAMYRAVTLAVLDAGVDPQDADAVLAVADRARVELGTDPADPHVLLDGRGVDAAVRSEPVTAAVSAVSAVPAVRERLVQQQRALAAGGAVVEGRDIGTVVCPSAPVKVFLVADPEERARRRGVQSGASDVASVQAALLRRDTLDSGRVASPLLRADGAVQLDTTALSVDEVVDHVLALCREAGL